MGDRINPGSSESNERHSAVDNNDNGNDNNSSVFKFDGTESEDDSIQSTDGSEMNDPVINYHEEHTFDIKYCWVCFATVEDDRTAAWVQPCLCRGTSKWVHQACVNRWIDEKQKGNAFAQVSCPQCNTKYIIVYPYAGLLVKTLDSIDTAVYKVCPFVAAGAVLGSMYWCAVTYGAVTVMVVIGKENGLRVMRQVDVVVLLIGLPVIPLLLILGNMVMWEDRVLTLLRRHVSELPLMRYILPSFALPDPSGGDAGGGGSAALPPLPPLASTISATHILCSALVLPSIAKLCGYYLFPSIRSSLQRTLLGGLTFIVIKGILKIYHKQQKFVMQKARRVLDYNDRMERRTVRGS